MRPSETPDVQLHTLDRLCSLSESDLSGSLHMVCSAVLWLNEKVHTASKL